MQRTCTQCQATFTIEQQDLDFYDKVSPVIGGKKILIPPPLQCPDCRRIRRLGVRNERHLYRRTCALSSRDIISMYAPDTQCRVYGLQEWWSDKWDAMDYGRPYDFSRPFFPQFAELQKEVPRITFLQYQNENSEYTNLVANLKNCYMVFSSDFDQDCQYGIWMEKSKSCADCLVINTCQLCYECVFSGNCYRCINAIYCSNCSDSAFLFHCKGCSNCLFCTGLRQKQYCIFNKQYTKEEYEKKLKEFPLTSRKNLEAVRKQFLTMMKNAAHPARWAEGRVENSTGDLLTDTANCTDCFEILNSKDCRFVHGAIELKDMMDGCYVGTGELGYENCEEVPMPFRSSFTMNSYTGSDLLYSDLCMNNTQNCFGCVGLKHKSHCILNKQYTKEEYDVLVPKIIEHMRTTGEWGEFFPLAQSFFGYNETVAQDFFPIAEETAQKRGWKWHARLEEAESAGQSAALPDDIGDLPASVTQTIGACDECKKNFKIIPQEIRFYRDMGLPLPGRCFDCRHTRRMALRNPTHLWDRTCAKCSKAIQTTYAPDRTEKILCEECYLKEVY